MTIGLSLALIMFSCHNPLNKTIFEKLTIDELKVAIGNDSSFENTYKIIQYKNDSILTTEIDRVKWSDLTYKRIHEFLRYQNDTIVFNALLNKWKLEWDSKYGGIVKQIDSISDYWEKYADENSLDKYVKIELKTIHKEYYTYISGIKNIDVGFELTPLKGDIEQITFAYNFVNKLDEDDNKTELIEMRHRYLLDYNHCRMTKPITKPTLGYWESSYMNENILKTRDVKSLYRDYNIDIRIIEIRVNDENIREDDLGIPESIIGYWKNKNNEWSDIIKIESGIKNVAEKLLDKEYIKSYDYFFNKKDSILTERDKLAHGFICLYMSY